MIQSARQVCLICMPTPTWYSGSADPKQLQKDDERIFIKYNKTRREEFQIKTCICERNVIGAAGASGAAGADATGNSAAGKKERYVEKAALSLDGSAHIASFKEKYEEADKAAPYLKGGRAEVCRAPQFRILSVSGWRNLRGEAGRVRLEGGQASAGGAAGCHGVI